MRRKKNNPVPVLYTVLVIILIINILVSIKPIPSDTHQPAIQPPSDPCPHKIVEMNNQEWLVLPDKCKAITNDPNGQPYEPAEG